MTIENLIIYTYNNGIETVEALREDLDCRRIGSSSNTAARRVPADSLIVNWGYGRMPAWAAGKRVRYLNHPNAVAAKMSKVVQLRKFAEAGVPTFECTTSRAEVQRWLAAGERVLCRQDEAARGLGIAVVERSQDIPGGTDFFTKWFDKTHEFRFHVFNGRIIDVVQKKRLNAAQPLATLNLTQQTVRNHANGWIEAHNNLYLPGDSRERLGTACIAAVRCLGLDFGAVDIVARFNGRELAAMAVCEVNTAPGCGAVEREAYVEAIKRVHQAT